MTFSDAGFLGVLRVKGMESESEGETLSTLFCLPSEKGSTLNGKNLLPFSVVLCIEKKQTEGHKSCLPCKNCVKNKIYQVYRITLRGCLIFL